MSEDMQYYFHTVCSQLSDLLLEQDISHDLNLPLKMEQEPFLVVDAVDVAEDCAVVTVEANGLIDDVQAVVAAADAPHVPDASTVYGVATVSN